MKPLCSRVNLVDLIWSRRTPTFILKLICLPEVQTNLFTFLHTLAFTLPFPRTRIPSNPASSLTRLSIGEYSCQLVTSQSFYRIWDRTSQSQSRRLALHQYDCEKKSQVRKTKSHALSISKLCRHVYAVNNNIISKGFVYYGVVVIVTQPWEDKQRLKRKADLKERRTVEVTGLFF